MIQGIVTSPVNMKSRAEIGVRAGDVVRVSQKIQEKGKVRLQVFEGLVLSVKHGTEPGATFTVRKVASGVGVEKTFPLYSPMIESIEIVRRSKVRRAKLYYIRDKVAREAKRALRRMTSMNVSTATDDVEESAEEVTDIPTEIPNEAPAEEAIVGAEEKTE